MTLGSEPTQGANLEGQITIPASSGSTELTNFFYGKSMKIDEVEIEPEFQEFIDTIGPQYKTTENLICHTSSVEHGGKTIGELAGEDLLTGHQVCAILAHLGSGGSSFLKIPEGADEVNIILGPVIIDGARFVLFIEHEIEDGVERISLHAKLPSHVEDGVARVLRIDKLK